MGLRTEIRYAAALRGLPPRVAWFLLRARHEARRAGDHFSLTSALPPRKLRVLLELAEGRTTVAELGTATAWTTLALALADPAREIVSYDPVTYPARDRYAALVAPAVRDRARFVAAPGETLESAPAAVDLLFVDSSHEREPTIAEFHAWRLRLAPGALVVFDDYDNAHYPGVRAAIDELGLAGEVREGLFAWRAPA